MSHFEYGQVISPQQDTGYLNRATAATHFNPYSMTKSANSIMVGLALADGTIHTLQDPLLKYVPELRGSGYGGTTLQNLLVMRSVVQWDDNFFAEGEKRS
jgi:CubicO group peptidase (beta-lactamase class C family)